MAIHFALKRDTYVGGGLMGAGYVTNVGGRYASITATYPPLASFYEFMERMGWELFTPPLKTMNSHAKEVYLMTFRHKKKSTGYKDIGEYNHAFHALREA